MARGVRFTKKSASRISDVVRRMESQPVNNIPGGRSRIPGDIRWFTVFNDSEEDMPGYGVGQMQSESVSVIEDGFVVPLINKPSTTFCRRFVVANPFGIPAQQPGLVTVDSPVHVLFNGSDPTFGSSYGPKPGAWDLWVNYPQVAHVEGVVDSDSKIMLVSWQLITEAYATANGSIAAGSSGAISIHQGTLGSTSAISSMDPTAYNAGPAVESGDPLSVGYMLGQLAFVKLCS